MTRRRKGFVVQKMARRLRLGLLVGALGIVLVVLAYWVSLLLINYHPAFIPNAEKRLAMFRASLAHPRPGGFWIF